PPPPGHPTAPAPLAVSGAPAGVGPGDLETIDGPVDGAAQPVAAPGAGAFAAPPEDAAPPVEKKSIFAKLFSSKPEGVAEDSNQSLPLRTWLLLGVTVLVTVGWLLWDDTPEEEAYTAEAAVVDPGQEGGEASPDGEGEGGTDPATPTPSTEPTPPVAEGTPTPPIPTPPTPVPPVESEEIDPDAPTLQRRAADATAQGQLEEALVLYRELAGNDPENEAYRLMVSILERRIAARGAATP
ncbi:MAG: hypothetical protein AAF682_32765, partial [Planctomycetota bacterium]